MERFLIIFHDFSDDCEYNPDLLASESNIPILKDTFEECEKEILTDIEYWKSRRPHPEEVVVNQNGYFFEVSDCCGKCKYYIRKIFL